MLRRNNRITKVEQNPSNAITSLPLDRFQEGDDPRIYNNYFKTDRECRYSDLFNADDSSMSLCHYFLKDLFTFISSCIASFNS